MTVTYGFYDSSSGDRVYNALQMSSIFDGIIQDGIFGLIGQSFRVYEYSGMDVQVGTGRAWFEHTWTLNDSLYTISVPASDPVLDRIDIVYLEVNKNSGVRANKLDILTGTPASTPVPPTLTEGPTVFQYALAHIYVNAGVTAIYSTDITDKVGDTKTPFVESGLYQPLLDGSVETKHLAGLAVTSAKLASGAVIAGKISSGAVTAGNIASGAINNANQFASGVVNATALASNAVSNAKIANDAVDDNKVGVRVPQMHSRQGGDSQNWSVPGSTDYVPGVSVWMQGGVFPTTAIAPGTQDIFHIIFDNPFDYTPIVLISLTDGATSLGTGDYAVALIDNVGQSGIYIKVFNYDSILNSYNIHWLAIGPEYIP